MDVSAECSAQDQMDYSQRSSSTLKHKFVYTPSSVSSGCRKAKKHGDRGKTISAVRVSTAKHSRKCSSNMYFEKK